MCPVGHRTMQQRLVAAEAEAGFEHDGEIGGDAEVAFGRSAAPGERIAEDELLCGTAG